MKKYSVLACLGSISLFMPSAFASTKEFMSVLKSQKVQYVSDSVMYQKVMHRLLAKNWSLGGSSLKVNFKANPKSEKYEDRREIKVMTRADAKSVIPEEIGLGDRSAGGGVYVGPLTVGTGSQKYVFVVTVDDRAWGYDANRFFVIFQKLDELDGHVPNEVDSISEKLASRLRGSEHVLPSGFAMLSAQGKEILTQLSNTHWSKTVHLQGQWGPLEWKQILQFQFWNDFQKINYSMKLDGPNGYRSVGPFTERVPSVFALGEKEVAPGVHEFAILAGDDNFYYQSGNRADVLIANEGVFGAKDWNQAEQAMATRIPRFYAYEGFDLGECRDLEKQTTARCTFEMKGGLSFSAGVIILRYDESQPKNLSIRYEVTHPLFEGATNTYSAE